MSGIKKFALDGAISAAFALFRDDINARIGALASLRPLRPEPDVAVFVSIKRIGFQVGDDQPFKFIPKIPSRCLVAGMTNLSSYKNLTGAQVLGRVRDVFV